MTRFPLAVPALAFLMGQAASHEAPTGWQYGLECCSAIDCRQLRHGEIADTPEGYLVHLTGEVIPYADKRIKRSKDEFFHQCTPAGRVDAKRSICLYVPEMAF